MVEHNKRDATGKPKLGRRWRQRNAYEAMIGASGSKGVEVVARPDKVGVAGDSVYPRNHAEVAKQARRRVGRKEVLLRKCN